MKTKLLVTKTLLIITIIGACTIGINSKAYAKKNFTITPKNVYKMAKSKYKRATNKYSKGYLGFNACLEKMGKKGGGTLTVKKGTYTISNAICVPSNVTIKFKKGVVFKKISKTGIKGQKAAKSMWQLVPKNKSLKKNSVKKYNGSKNVKMIAEGKVTFDMGNKNGICVVVCHNNNVEISGITFKGMNGNHYVEINGSKNVNIHNNVFAKAKSSTKKKNYNKEAINIDTPDSKTHGLPLKWVKHDLTPCENLTIENNTFNGTTRGVGTHKYSQKSGKNVFHKNVKVVNNRFKNVYDNGVFILNWEDATIENNVFDNIGKSSKLSYSSGSHGISGGGVNNITIKKNKFSNIKRNPIYFGIQQNNKAGHQYKSIGNNITKDQFRTMTDNSASKCGSDINSKYKGYNALIFNGKGTREEKNAIGIIFSKKTIWYGKTGETEKVTPDVKPQPQPSELHDLSKVSIMSVTRVEFTPGAVGPMVNLEMSANDGSEYVLTCVYGDLEYYENNKWNKVEVTSSGNNGEIYGYSEKSPVNFILSINNQQGDVWVMTKSELKPGKYRYWQKTGDGDNLYAVAEFTIE